MKNLVLLFALCAVSTQFASADTLTVTGTGSNQTDGFYVYPYYLSLDGGPSQDMMCLSFNNEISQGETWAVTPTAVTGTVDEEAAWLFNDAQEEQALGNAETVIDDQVAAWSLFASDVPTTAGSDAQLALAVSDSSSEPAGFYSQVVFYTPTGAPSRYGSPQTFIAETPTPEPEPLLIGVTPTPEPGSLFLLGTGLFVLWGSGKLLQRTLRLMRPTHRGCCVSGQGSRV
jgi:hypothetical protein